MADALEKMRCRYCGQTAYRLALIALLQGAGARTSNGADRCWAREDGVDHDFSEPQRSAA